MKMKFPLLTSLVLLTLQGCASHKIGPEATFVSEADRNNPPLEVSASFRDDLCGYSLGYLVVSIRNPSSEWRRMNATELSFPYNSDADFHVVGGRDLLAWADAQSLKAKRETHNAAMARLAVRTVSRVMMASDNDSVAKTGAVMTLGEKGAYAGQSIIDSKKQASAPAGNGSNHLLAGELIIPPKMDRTFWVLLNADSEAPLLNWLAVSYQDENQQTHQFVTVPSHQEQCRWQQDRVRFLEDWGLENGVIKTRRTAGEDLEILPYEPASIEAAYQKQQKALASE